MRLLIIQSYGSKLAVRDGIFELTLVEDKCLKKQDIAPSELSAIWIQNGCNLTTAAIALATEHNIDLLLLNGLGVPIGRWLPSKPTNIVTMQRAQLLAYQDEQAVSFVKLWIAEKMQNQADFLKSCAAYPRKSDPTKVERLQKSITQIESYRQKILLLQATQINDIAETIRGIEGAAGRAYFQAITTLLPERYHFEQRNRFPATDAFNSCLNYAYAVLYNKIESAILKVGLNPYAGFLHSDGHQQLSMVYDFVEPFRIMVEVPIFTLFSSKTITQAHFDDSNKEKLWLSKAGKILIINILQDYLKEKTVLFENKKTNREQLIFRKTQLFAHQLLAAYQQKKACTISIADIENTNKIAA